MAKEYLRDREPDEPTYNSDDEYNQAVKSKREIVGQWKSRIESADKAFKAWADRFKVEMLYQYYEGFQWFFITDENNRPYVMNMVYSTIENKLPSLTFDNPQFALRARPRGLEFDEETANKLTQGKEDALNFVSARDEFGLSDKHELAILDALFGFGVIEVNYSEELCENPYLPILGKPNEFDKLYCKQIPYDQFRVSANANWDLSQGKWFGYYEFVPHDRLQEYKDKLNLKAKPYSAEDIVSVSDTSTGKINVATETQLSSQIVGPPDTCKIWRLWDFNTNKFYLYSEEASLDEDKILEEETFDFNPISTLRLGKRRKGWYPYPPVWNWISPQDEINDTRQAQRLHRKRFSRKYEIIPGRFENEEEIDKFLYGPDGTVIRVNMEGAIKAIEDAPQDPVDAQTLAMAYDDFNRASATPDEYRATTVSANRTTATQAGIMDRRSQVREAKDAVRVANFMCSIGRTILKALRKAKKPFWVRAKLDNESFMGEVKLNNYQWKRIPKDVFKDEDFDVDLNVTSVSPISAQTDKQAFMEFMALITQYEILAFSPALLREAAYRCGYKNESVLNQLQQWAQLAAIGRQVQLQQQAGGPPQGPPGAGGQQPNINGQAMAEQTNNGATPPDMSQIANLIFNRGAGGAGQ